MPQISDFLDEKIKDKLEHLSEEKTEHGFEDKYDEYLYRVTEGDKGIGKLAELGGLRWVTPSEDYSLEIVRNRVWISESYLDSSVEVLFKSYDFDPSWSINVTTINAPILCTSYDFTEELFNQRSPSFGLAVDQVSDYFTFLPGEDVHKLLSDIFVVGSCKFYVSNHYVYSLLLPARVFKEFNRYVEDWGSLSTDFR